MTGESSRPDSNGGWTRLCQATVALAAAWAEFKLALDAYREAK